MMEISLVRESCEYATQNKGVHTMEEHLLFRLFLIHASQETQRTLITYTIEYLKWRYGVKTLEEVKRAFTTRSPQGTHQECSTIAAKNGTGTGTEPSAEML